MTIRINQIAVDFTLEKEKTFADLTESLQEWAATQELAIMGVLADGKALEPQDNLPLSDVQLVEVEAVPTTERDLARMDVISQYFALLAQALERNDQAMIGELHRDYPSIREALILLASSMVRRWEANLAVLDGPWADGQTLGEVCRNLANETGTLRWEWQQPEKALAVTLSNLSRGLDELENLAVLFQKGQDKDGFALILRLFTLLEDLGRRIPLAITKREERLDWEGLSGELQPFLKEAEDALSSGDYILLTDLLEYEVTPRLRTIPRVISALRRSSSAAAMIARPRR